jgi:hypothetical protein
MVLLEVGDAVHPVVCLPRPGVESDFAVRWEGVFAHTVVVPAAG